MNRCPVCGNKELLVQPKPQTFRYKGYLHPIYYETLVCVECYGEVVPEKAIKHYKKELDNFRHEVDNKI